MITLYDYILSDDCYKVRLLLSMLRLPFTAVKVNIHPGREHREAAFLALNPLGRIPVLVDDALVLRDPQAILTYLALRYDGARRWWPDDPAVAGRVAMWLAFAGQDLAALSAARAIDLFGLEEDPAGLQAAGTAALEVLEDHLAACAIAGQDWVAAGHATIADLALFPAVAMAPEGGVSLDTLPAVWRWLGRVKRLPGFIVMPGVLPLLV